MQLCGLKAIITASKLACFPLKTALWLEEQGIPRHSIYNRDALLQDVLQGLTVCPGTSRSCFVALPLFLQ